MDSCKTDNTWFDSWANSKIFGPLLLEYTSLAASFQFHRVHCCTLQICQKSYPRFKVNKRAKQMCFPKCIYDKNDKSNFRPDIPFQSLKWRQYQSRRGPILWKNKCVYLSVWLLRKVNTWLYWVASTLIWLDSCVLSRPADQDYPFFYKFGRLSQSFRFISHSLSDWQILSANDNWSLLILFVRANLKTIICVSTDCGREL